MSQAALSPGRNLPLSSGDRREHPRYRSKDSSVLGMPALCRNGRGMLCSGASRPGNSRPGGDKLAPEDTITTAEALVMLERAAGLPDVGQLRDDLGSCRTPPAGGLPGRPMQSGT